MKLRDVLIGLACIPLWCVVAPFVWAVQVLASRKTSAQSYN